jgi:hypothetical protein
VSREQRKLHNEKPCGMHSSSDIIIIIIILCSDQVKKMDMQNFKRNCKGKIPFQKCCHSWKNDSKTDIKEMRCEQDNKTFQVL